MSQNIKNMREPDQKITNLKRDLISKSKYVTALLSIIPEGFAQDKFKPTIGMILKIINDKNGNNLSKVTSSIDDLIDKLEKTVVAPNDLNTEFYNTGILKNLIAQLADVQLPDVLKATLREEMNGSLILIENMNNNHAITLSKSPINKLSLLTRRSIDDAIINTNVLISNYRERIELLKSIDKAKRLLKDFKTVSDNFEIK